MKAMLEGKEVDVTLVGPPDTPLDESLLDPAVEPILKYFRFSHLPAFLAEVSIRFASLAILIVGTLPRCAERTVALRKLLESKDAAVRACLP